MSKDTSMAYSFYYATAAPEFSSYEAATYLL